MSQSKVGGHTLPDNGNTDKGYSNDIEKLVDAVRIMAAVVISTATQQTHVADPAAAASLTFAAGSIDTGTDMTAAEAAQLVADIAALKAAVDANNTAIDSILAQLATIGVQATS